MSIDSSKSTLPIYEVLRNRFFIRKIISLLPKRIIKVTTDDQWRWKYFHWKKLSSLINSPYHSLIIDKIKTNSLTIKYECITELVKKQNFDFKTFERIYTLKQWMFTNEYLLFDAIDSGCLNKVKLLFNQSEPVRFLRVYGNGSKKTNYIEYAFASQKYDIYEYFIQNNVNEQFSDLSPSFKAKALLSSLSVAKDLSYLEKIAHSKSDSDDLQQKELSKIKLEISNMNPRQYAKNLLVRTGGLSLIKVFFPNHQFESSTLGSSTLEFFLVNYKDLYSVYQLEVMEYLANEVFKVNLNLDTIISNVKDQIVASYETLKSYTSQVEEPRDLWLLEHLLVLTRCIKMFTKLHLNKSSYKRFYYDIIRCGGLVGLPPLFQQGDVIHHVVSIFKYGTLEQVKYGRLRSLEVYPNLFSDWIQKSMANPRREIFGYLVEEYGLDMLHNSIDFYDVYKLSMDTPEKFRYCISINGILNLAYKKFKPALLTKSYLQDIIELTQRNQNFTSLIDISCQSLTECLNNEDDLETIKFYIKHCNGFNTMKNIILLACMRALNYEYVQVCLENDDNTTAINGFVDTIGMLGDIQLLELVIDLLSDKDYQDVLYYACCNGCFQLLDHCKLKYPERNSIVDDSTKPEHSVNLSLIGRIDIIQYYLNCSESKDILVDKLITSSVISGYLDIFQFLVNYHLTKPKKETMLESLFTESIIKSAINSSKFCIPLFKYAIELGCKLEISEKLLKNHLVKNSQLKDIFNDYLNKQV